MLRTYRYKATSFQHIILSLFRWFFASTPRPISIDPQAIEILDGDTIRAAGIVYRLHGYDTPEIFAPRCSHELADGRAATHALRRILQTTPTLSLTVVDRDHYGRAVADATIAGRDVASLMIEAGYARAYDGHTARRAWCACAASS